MCGCCGCCVGVVGTCGSRGAELERTCGRGEGGGCFGEGDDDAEILLEDSFGGGVGGRVLGCGRSSGIGILLKCTVRLDGGVYVCPGGPSSLMRCNPTVGLLSYITYWCRSSDSSPALTSAKIIGDVRWGDGHSPSQLTTFVSQALHLLNHLQHLWYVGR